MKENSSNSARIEIILSDISKKDRILLILSLDDFSPKTTKEIKDIGSNLGLTEIYRWNVSQILSNYPDLVLSISRTWNISSKGREYIESLVNDKSNSSDDIPELDFIDDLTSQVSDEYIKNFINEAIGCFKAGFYRASIVLAWEGAISVLYDYVIKNRLADFNIEATRRFQNRNNRWKPARNYDDLTNMKESEFLEVLVVLSIIGNDVKKELLHKLTMRNSCGHPNSLSIGKLTVGFYLEFLVKNVFQKF